VQPRMRGQDGRERVACPPAFLNDHFTQVVEGEGHLNDAVDCLATGTRVSF
jgi:hypothetical protein